MQRKGDRLKFTMTVVETPDTPVTVHLVTSEGHRKSIEIISYELSKIYMKKIYYRLTQYY